MNILIIDGQGGGIGCQLIQAVRTKLPDADITAVGTNSIATAQMVKNKPDRAATGENAVIVACRKAEVIMGPVGIAIADALVGEVSPAMAAAVGQSDARKIFIPINKCEIMVAGVKDLPMSRLIEEAVEILTK